MKRSFFLMTVLVFIMTSCSVKVTKESTLKYTFNSVESATTLDGLANALFNKITGKDVNALKAIQPTPAIAKVIAPDPTNGLSDDEIQKRLLTPMFEKVDQNIENIRASLKDNKLDIDNTKLIEIKHFPDDAMGSIEVGSIHMENKNFLAKVPFTFIIHENRYYMLEILMSSDAFQEKL